MKVIFIIAQKGFQDIEYNNTRKALEAKSIAVEVAAPQKSQAIGKFNGIVNPDKAIKDVKSSDYDAISVIGGPGALSLLNVPELTKLLKDFEKAGKIISAICIAPVILAKSGLLKYKKATVWNGDGMQSSVIEREGAQYTGENVTVDGKILTANGPEAATSFGEKLADLLIHK